MKKNDKKTDKRKIRKIAVIFIISALAAALIIPKMIYRINEGLVESEAAVEDIDYTEIILTGYSGINPTRANKVIESIIRNQTITPDEEDIGQQFTDIMVQKAIYYAIRYNYSVG